MESIFGRTSSYRPREGRISEEDFFTEVFAGVLEHDSELCIEIFSFFTCLDEKDFTVKIYTQKSYPSESEDRDLDRPDLELRAYRKDGSKLAVVLVESKISSGEGKDQLKSYAALLDKSSVFKEFPIKMLAYITKYPDKVKMDELIVKTNDFEHFNAENNFKECTWAKVYSKVKEHVNSGGSETVLAEQLKQFMEEINMSNEIKKNDLLAMKTYNDSVPKLSSILGEAWNGSTLRKVKEGRHMERWEKNGLFSRNYQLTEENIGIWYGFASNEINDCPAFNIPDNGMPVVFVVLRKYDDPREYRGRILKNDKFMGLFQPDAWQIEGNSIKNIAYTYKSAGEIMNEDPYNDLVKYFRERLNELEPLFRE